MDGRSDAELANWINSSGPGDKDAPVIYMQWNDGYAVWEQVIPEAAGHEGVVAFIRAPLEPPQ
jgi:hypothetical protein